jgi:fatty-acyl-CoA synthase
MDLDPNRCRERLESGLGHRWQPMPLARRFDSLAAAYPDRPYVITDARSYSYRELRDWSRRLARGLYGIGVRPGERVALVVDNRPEFVAVKLAIARLGAVAVPVNFSYRADELAVVLNSSQASVLISIDAAIGVDRLAVLDELVPGWEGGAPSDTVPHLRRVVLVDHERRPAALDLRGLLDHAAALPESGLNQLEDAVDPGSPCDIVFTSGTSGYPLGAVLSHDMVLRSAYGSAYHRAFDDGWRICFSLPLYHVFGYVEGLLAAMFAGGAIVPQPVFNPRSILAAMQQHRASEVLFVPTMSVAVVEEAARSHYDLSHLQSVFSAAAAAPVWLWQRIEKQLAPRQVFTGYGQTEVSAATTLTLPGDPVELVAETIGREKLGGVAAPPDLDGALVRYRTVDPFTGAPLPPGTEGELSARGPIVTRGYFNDPERTAAQIDAGGWLRSGDLGRVRDDGYLELTGRSGELFKVGGELVAPQQVEQVLTGYHGVAQAYVAGVPDDRLGEVGWAWIVAGDGDGDGGDGGGARPSEAELLRHCRSHLAAFKVPRKITFLSADELPKTSTGKVQKYLLVRDRPGS